MLERRKHPRIKCHFFTELCEGDDNNSIGVGEIFDLSESGAGLESHIPFLPGQRVFMRFIIDGNLITLPVEVIHVREKGRRKFWGTKFLEVPQQTKEIIRKFMLKCFK